MNKYGTSKIRNVCLLGHGGAGKTSLTEAMLFNTGVLDRLGKIADGTTTSDYDPEEVKRKFSINTSINPCEWNGSKINVIDAPGYFDFYGEVHSAARVAEGALIVLPAKEGIAVGTELAWSFCKERNVPRMLFINKMDEDNVDFYKKLGQIEAAFGNTCIPLQLPFIDNGKYIGYTDVLAEKSYRFDGKGGLTEANTSAAMTERLAQYRAKLWELVAETDEELMEKYFAEEDFTSEDLKKGLTIGVRTCGICPVFCGSAAENLAVKQLMDAIVDMMPSLEDMGEFKAANAGGGITNVKPDANGPLSALVFKTIADPFVGRISIFKVYSGTLKSEDTVYNAVSQSEEKMSRIFMLRGKKQIPVDSVTAGDIGAVAKLVKTNTNDTLCNKDNVVILDKIAFPAPSISLAAAPKTKGDEDKISAGFTKLQDEDPTFKVALNTETKQTVISGLGEQHLDIICAKLQSKYGVSVTLSEPKIAYRETIRKKAKVEGKHKKQSGGHGQYGHVWIEFEPCDSDTLVFEEKVFGGSVPKNFFPAVEKGLQDCVKKGVLAGYPVEGVKATLLDGSYHPVDSSEMAFKIAASLAYKKGMAEASPVLLEPVGEAKVLVPERYMGDIIGDMNKRRGRILGMNPEANGFQEIVAEVPFSEMVKYATDLRSMTQARGSYTMTFVRYEDVPASIAKVIIENSKDNLAGDIEE